MRCHAQGVDGKVEQIPDLYVQQQCGLKPKVIGGSHQLRESFHAVDKQAARDAAAVGVDVVLAQVNRDIDVASNFTDVTPHGPDDAVLQVHTQPGRVG